MSIQMVATNIKPNAGLIRTHWHKIGTATYDGVFVTIYADQDREIRYVDNFGYECDTVENANSNQPTK